MFEKIDETISEIKSLYLSDDRPWVVGYSGGKDSTSLVQLIFYALMELKKENRTKGVHIISSDTLVEIPNVASEVKINLTKIQSAAN